MKYSLAGPDSRYLDPSGYPGRTFLPCIAGWKYFQLTCFRWKRPRRRHPTEAAAVAMMMVVVVVTMVLMLMMGGAVDDDSPGRGWALPTQPWWEEKQLTLMFPAHGNGNASHFPAYCLNKTDFGQQALIFLMIASKLFWHINFRNATFRIASLGSE